MVALVVYDPCADEFLLSGEGAVSRVLEMDFRSPLPSSRLGELELGILSEAAREETRVLAMLLVRGGADLALAEECLCFMLDARRTPFGVVKSDASGLDAALIRGVDLGGCGKDSMLTVLRSVLCGVGVVAFL